MIGGAVVGFTQGGNIVAVLDTGSGFGGSNGLVSTVTHDIVTGCGWFSSSSSEVSSSGSGC